MNTVLYFNSLIEPKGGVFSMPVILLLVVFHSLVILLFVLSFGLVASIKNSTLSLTDREVIIKSALYGRKIPIENIAVDEIKTINLYENPEFDISIRTNGTRLPNVSLGWMRLKNSQKALVFITDKTNVVMIPTKDFIVLFSMNNAGEFKEKITALRGN